MSKRTHKHRCGYVPNPRKVSIFNALMLEMEREEMRNRLTCGLVFEHVRPPPEVSSEEYRAAHLCPNCGTHNTWIYKGRLKAGQGVKSCRKQK